MFKVNEIPILDEKINARDILSRRRDNEIFLIRAFKDFIGGVLKVLITLVQFKPVLNSNFSFDILIKIQN